MKTSSVSHKTTKQANPKADKAKPIEDTLMFSLIVAGHTARAKTTQVLTELNLHIGDDAILFAVQSAPDLNEFELAEMIEQSVPDVVSRLERLHAQALIERTPNVRLSAKGQVTVRKILEHWQSLDTHFASGLKHKKQKKLRNLFRRFSGL